MFQLDIDYLQPKNVEAGTEFFPRYSCSWVQWDTP